MSKFIFLILISFLFFKTYSQTGQISGRVVDSKTLEPLIFASVFVNNTTIGTASDENGHFTLTHVPFGTFQMVFSFVGYQTYQTKITLSENKEYVVNVKLIADERLLENVSVTGTRDREWEKQLKRFSKIFLGSNNGSAYCRILNPWELEFSEENGELRAEASLPIEIENGLLGYKLSYFLIKFKEKAGTFEMLGNVRFDEIETFDPKIYSQWMQNRLDVYKGSQRHLFKSILNHKIREEGFKLYEDKHGFENSPRSTLFAAELGKSIEEFDSTKILIIPEKLSGAYQLVLAKKLEVHYTKGTTRIKSYDDVNAPVSWIELKSGMIKVNSDGAVLDLNNIVSSGYMSSLRVSDMLPYDYQPPLSNKLTRPLEPVSAMNNLQERVHVVTDKPYYYQGDMLWFRGVMQYSDPKKLDTMSRVLKVELIDSEKHIIQSKNCLIDSGRIEGNFYLDEHLGHGDYYLRAYTNWMRNFGDTFFFVKPFKLLTLYDHVIESTEIPLQPDTSKMNVIIIPDQGHYKTREKISLTIKIKNGNNEWEQPAALSIAVVDIEQVVVPRVKTFSPERFEYTELPAYSKPIYPIEYGISLGGIFRNNKGKAEKSNITLIQGNTEDIRTIDTDDLGKFWVSGFSFKDSAEFAIQAKNKKRKVYGKVTLTQEDPPVITELPEPLTLPLQKADELQHYKINYDFQQTKLLEEVIIKAKPLNFKEQDNTVQKERIEPKNYGRLFTTIQGKVPGLEVDTYMISNANSAYSWRIGYSSRNKEPLLVTDGLPYTGSDPVARQLAMIDPASVDHVELLRYNSAVKFGAKGGGAVVIAVYTKRNMIESDKQVTGSFDKNYFQIQKVKGYSVPDIFTSPDYSNKDVDHSQPDFRSTIYWNPSLHTQTTGEASVIFYAADLSTHYKVLVEGMSLTGKHFYGECLIEIQ